MLDLRLQFETIRDLRGEIVRNVAETKRRLLDVETRQSETVREVSMATAVSMEPAVSMVTAVSMEPAVIRCQLLMILSSY